MVSDQIFVQDSLPIIGGFDIGGGTLNSAAIFAQRHPRGPYLIHDEVCPDDDGIGLHRFAEEVSYVLSARFPNPQNRIQHFWGDPAGRTRDPLFEVTVFDHLMGMGLPVMEAPSNDPRLRVEAIKSPMGRLVEGKPGIIIHPRCKQLIKGLLGGWSYKRMQVSSSEERFRDVPDKNQYSHICDALGYMLLGSGEGNVLRARGMSRSHGPVHPKKDFKVFG
jgi:hypothetical protein